MNNWGMMLKKVRMQLGLTQKQMAGKLGYTRQDIISGIENGNRTMSGVAKKCLGYFIELKETDTLKEENCKMRDTLILYDIDEEIWKIK